MSGNDEEKQKLNNPEGGDKSKANGDANAKDEEDEDDGYSCSKCWNGYCGCIICVCKVFIVIIIH